MNKLHAREVIPESVIKRIPSAELRYNQKDSDSLPEYDVLDSILKAYIEEEKSLSEIIALGFDPHVALKVITMVDKNEYKRRQCPPGVKITPKAFGRDRRMPMTNRYRQRINNNI
ncbi:MAG: Glutamine-dependent NAD(+) synthetase [Planctomycetes bacterium ADurb.Bin401]|nr:MAG: Glutamine-dependent NAD(+) synthetase [Planctomycetes bacterium ADurb.Bin401]